MDKAKWTFMVYMAGDNSLDGAALKDLAEMARAGFTNAVNVLVQLDRLKDHKTRRFRITKGGGYNKDCIETFGETDTGDPRPQGHPGSNPGSGTRENSGGWLMWLTLLFFV